MTPFERGINRLLEYEQQQCIRMHQAVSSNDRRVAYTDAANTRICINLFARAYLNDKEKFSKFEAAMAKAHSDVYVGAFLSGLDLEADMDELYEEVTDADS